MKNNERGRINRWSELKKLIHKADVIVELVDARDVSGTRIPIAERWAGTRRLLVVVNKIDLLPENMHPVFLPRSIHVSAKKASKEERRQLIRAILSRTQTRPAKALFIGYPNIGKSSLINMLAGRKVARVSPVAGTTMDVQWININNVLVATDYRGIFPEKQTKESLVRKGAINVHGEELVYAHKFAREILANKTLRNWLERRYDIDLNNVKSPDDVLAIIAERRKWYVSGGELNILEAARSIVRAMAEAPEI